MISPTISPTLIYEPTAKLVAWTLITAEAYVVDLNRTYQEWFEWKSGIHAPVHCDCRVLAGYPGANRTIVNCLRSSIDANFSAVQQKWIIGLADAGIRWSALVAQDLNLPDAFVRKQPKQHGRLSGRVECSPPTGAQAVLVDDLVASGGSVEGAVLALREEKDIEVIGIQSIVNWDFPEMRERFQQLDIPVRSLVSFPTLLEVSVKLGRLTQEAADELVAFYQNPRQHRWNLLTGRAN